MSAPIDLATLALKVVPRLPSLKYSIAFGVFLSIYIAFTQSSLASTFSIALATLFAISLNYADHRVSESIVGALRVCGAKPILIRIPTYFIAISRTLIALACPVATCLALGQDLQAVLLILIPLLASVLVEELRVVRRK